MTAPLTGRALSPGLSRGVRLALPLGLALSFALVGYAAPADAATTPSATIGAVTCVGEDGQVEVTLDAADDADSTFVVTLDGDAVGEEDGTTVPAGGTRTVTIPGLEDDDHHVAVDLVDPGEEPGSDPGDETTPDETTPDETAPDPGSEEGDPGDEEGDPGDEPGDDGDLPDGGPLAEADLTVACDAAPVGAYSHPRGTVEDYCEAAHVTASNKPIGGNVADLQPVTFTVTITHDGGEPEQLDSFVLDADTRTYERDFTADELGDSGTVTLQADGATVAQAEYSAVCEVSAAAGGAGGPINGSAGGPYAGPTAGAVSPTSASVLPDTGAGPYQGALALLGALLVVAGAALVRSSSALRTVPRHRGRPQP